MNNADAFNFKIVHLPARVAIVEFIFEVVGCAVTGDGDWDEYFIAFSCRRFIGDGFVAVLHDPVEVKINEILFEYRFKF